MKCPFCGQDKPLVEEVLNHGMDGIMSNFNICQECSDTYLTPVQETETVMFTTGNDLIAFIESIADKLGINPSVPVVGACECGWTQDDVDRDGRFGCAKCYDHFSQFMKDMVFPYHKANQHMGKVIKEGPITVKEKLNRLKLNLAKAVELENFEQASLLRDEITALQNDPSISVDQ